MADPVGEDGWLTLVDEASRTASDLEQRVGVVELYKRAISTEPWSIKLWLAYCEWVWSLYTDCQTADAGWPEEEQLLGQELFSLEIALDVWQQGAQATQYRLNDSHELWNRWVSIEQEELSKSLTEEKIDRIRSLFLDRLQIPHATWDETSQMFSTFITRYDEPAWESTMVETTKLAKPAKDLYSWRESQELKLQRAMESGDVEAQKSVMGDYLEWEVEQAEKRNRKGASVYPLILCVALYERALSSTALGLEPSTWEDYMDFLSNTRSAVPQAQLPTILSVIQRATSHCPWSGPLWGRYIEIAESEKLAFEDLERIKHAATNTNPLDRDGMGGVVEFFVAWSGYLKRRTAVQGATDEDIDVAEMGLPTALESVQDWGQRVYGKKDYKGDPQFRIERIMIQHLTQKGSIEEARGYWRKLVNTHADSYEFWQQYYLWEMTVYRPNAPPSLATMVLHQALHREALDWPEKIMEVYIRHCVNYEEVETLLVARRTVRRLSKKVAKRREREAVEAAAIYAQQQPEVAADEAMTDGSPSGVSKRKRESVSEDVAGSASKKVKSLDQEALRQQHLKRDRENTTVLVTNLPAEVTQTKIRQYFKEYGHMNSMTLKTNADGISSTALIEFRSPEDVQSALLRDGKYFIDRQIRVEPGTGLTLYVTNYPPSADDAYMCELFKDCGEIFSVRWPSLKHNTHRRFCYISFRTQEAAASATQLHDKKLGGVYKLIAQYSDPGNKKSREGALAEGREIHITSLDKSLSEENLKDVFAQYGKVERVRILTNRVGESSGAAFISFEKKEEATAALAMDNTKLKASVLKVEMSTHKNFKPTATSMGTKGLSASPAPDADGNSVMSASPAPEAHATNTLAKTHPAATESANRTITLMNIPDTVNDARIRVLAEPYGDIVKLVLRPDHQGAIIEFADIAAAGRAALGLENHELVPGRRLRTGGLKDLFREKDEIKTDRIQIGQGKKAPASFIQPSAPIRRPGPGGRGGLGMKKRGLGYSAVSASWSGSGDIHGQGKAAENKVPKSNAEFKAMFVSGGKE
jgi:RNA recognition motif-containing protein